MKLLMAILFFGVAGLSSVKAEAFDIQSFRTKGNYGQILRQIEQVLKFEGYEIAGEMSTTWGTGGSHRNSFESTISYVKNLEGGKGKLVENIKIRGIYMHSPNGISNYYLSKISVESVPDEMPSSQ